jgi:hypothetical protein
LISGFFILIWPREVFIKEFDPGKEAPIKPKRTERSEKAYWNATIIWNTPDRADAYVLTFGDYLMEPDEHIMIPTIGSVSIKR